MNSIEKLKEDFKKLGIKEGDVVLMHSSFKSLGEFDGGAKAFYQAFLEVLGEAGTLIVPSLSYETVTRENPEFDKDTTPSCVGYLSEYFRTQVDGVIRSLHPTHSCCVKGKYAKEITEGHEKDVTPVGENSPFTKLPKYNGKILMLGCGTRCNTLMHGIEETAEPPYCLNREKTVNYIIRDGKKTIEQEAYRHNFATKDGGRVVQRYDRIIDLLPNDKYNVGNILAAECYLMDAKAVWEEGYKKLVEDQLYFVDYPN